LRIANEAKMLEAYNNRALLVDLYELTMAAGYYEHGIDCLATFELFVRAMPPERGYLVAAGLDSALGYLENLRFKEEDVAFLRSLSAFRTVSDGFFDYLRGFRFTGDVWAMEEGTLVFAGEPILRVTAPVAQAQIAETYLLSVINYETLVASKAARVVRAAQGRPVWEFGTRRAQGPQAGVRAARAAYVGGCAGTSNVLAGYLYGVPLAGTAAHSWTQVFPDERQSFEALLETFPETAILLIDTYDPLTGAENAASLGRKLAGVRLDSGDLLTKSRQVREILDRHGLRETKIFASGDLNEYKVEELVRQGAPIDTFGVGTELATSRDVPALSVVYKLVEIERNGQVEYKTKFSHQKAHWPGKKQVFRFPDAEGRFHHDLVARASEHYADGVPLLKPMMEGGRRLQPSPPLAELRARTLDSLARLPERYQSLHAPPRYPVAISAALEQLLESVRDHYRVSEETYMASRVQEEAKERVVFVDVDTQVDFMYPSGSLYVPGAEQIIPQLARLMNYARSQGIPVLSSADAHSPDDPSFAQWPPHCVVGTPGQQRIPETQLPGAVVVPNRAGAFHPPAEWPAQVIIEKQEYDASTNANFDTILGALGPARFVVFGVATEYCVRATALSLRRRGLAVDLVVDAIRPITEEGGQKAIEEMVRAGVRLVKVEEVCAPQWAAVAPATAR
jgi:nicotinate phosphoribosyltransferase